MAKLPIYDLRIDDNDETSGVYLISFVDEPAIEKDFIKLSNQKKVEFKVQDKMQQLLTGPALIPDFLILRSTQKGEFYYVKFSSEEIRKIAKKFLRNGYTHNTNQQHEIELQGNYIVENWFVDDPAMDKCVSLGYVGLPKGTWMVTYHIPDTEYWNKEIMSGNVKGFSIEGFFNQIEIEMNKQIKEEMNKDKNLIQKIKSLLFGAEKYNFSEYKAKDGTMIWVEEGTLLAYKVLEDGTKEKLADGTYDLEDGSMLVVKDGVQVEEQMNGEPVKAEICEYILEDGSMVYADMETMAVYIIKEDGSQVPAPDGDHKLQDGKILVVKDGLLVEVKEMEMSLEDGKIAEEMGKLVDKMSVVFEKQKTKIDQLEEKLSKQGKAIAKLEKSFEEFSKAPAAKPINFSKTMEKTEDTSKKKIFDFSRLDDLK